MPTILLTGASMGIGSSLARAWAKRGSSITLVLSARGRDGLEAVAREVERLGARAIVEVGDVTDAAHRARLVERAVQETGSIDVLVNNAGRGFHAPALRIDLEEMRRLFELNVFAPLHLIQLAAPHLECARGTIVMLSSIAGIVAAPRFGAYAASKFALEAIAMSLRAEVADKGIRVVVVRPGPVATPFRANAVRVKEEGRDGYDSPDPRSQSPEEVAKLTLAAVDRGTSVVETSAFVRVAGATARLAPPILRRALQHMARSR